MSRRVAAAALCEMHDSQAMLDRVEREGFRVWRGDREDSEANPVVWDPQQIKATERFSRPLLPAGVRAGKRNMAKTLNAVRGVHLASGRHVIICARHQIQTLGPRERAEAGREFNQNTAAALGRRRAVMFVGGDDNAEWNHPTLEPMRAAAWRAAQSIRGELPTHKVPDPKRAIDDWWMQDRDADPGVMRFRRKWVGPPHGSDHLPLYVEALLTVRGGDGTAPLVLVTYNRGNRNTADDLLRVLHYKQAA